MGRTLLCYAVFVILTRMGCLGGRLQDRQQIARSIASRPVPRRVAEVAAVLLSLPRARDQRASLARRVRLSSCLWEPRKSAHCERMEKPTCPPCIRCGQQPRFIASMLDPKAGRTFHMFQCQCGDKSWISEKSG